MRLLHVKRILAAALCAVFIAALLPVAAYAEPLPAVAPIELNYGSVNCPTTITSNFTPELTDTGAASYDVVYTDSMDTSDVWTKYAQLVALVGQDNADLVTISGSFTISCTFDSRLTADAAKFTAADLTLSDPSGLYTLSSPAISGNTLTATISIAPITGAAFRALGTQPSTMTLTTASGALTLTAAKFEAGKSVATSASSFSGTISLGIPAEKQAAVGALFQQTAPVSAITLSAVGAVTEDSFLMSAAPVATDVTVTYDPMRGNFAKGESGVRTGKPGEALNAPTGITRKGYIFLGWYIEKNYSNIAPSVFPEKDATYYARWLPGSIFVNVTYDPCGGALAADESGVRTGEAGDALNAPADPTRKGYSFGGWFTEKEGAGSAAPSVFPNAEATYYAKWIPNTVTVTYDPFGGALAADESGKRSGKTGDALSAPADPSLADYLFCGWFTEPYGKGEAAPVAFPAEDTTYYALWVPKASAPKTGDESMTALFAVLLCASGAALAVTLYKKKKLEK